MPTMDYLATATRSITPSLVKMSFTITKSDPDVNNAVSELHKARKEARRTIFTKNSLIKDSYVQTYIDVVPKFKTVETKKTDGKDEKIVKDKVFDCYSASTTLAFNLSNDETVIDDFTDIMNMTIALNSRCSYDFGITDDERQQIYQELYSEAIDNGMAAVRNIIAKSSELSEMTPYIMDINTNPSSNRDYAATKYRCGNALNESDMTYEPIITPEIIFDMFSNKKITLASMLVLKLDLRGPRSI